MIIIDENVIYCDVCGVSSEEKIVKLSKKYNQCLCSKHMKQMYTYGKITDPTSRTTRDKNEYIIHEDYAEIVLRNSKNDIVGTAKVDLEDVEKCKQYKWALRDRSRGTKYVYTKKPGFNTTLHRYVTGYGGELDIDHIDRDTFNNRKSNLRIVDRTINAQNKPAVGNISEQQNGKWRAIVTRFGKWYNVGTFNTYEEAVAAKDEFVRSLEESADELLSEYGDRRSQCVTGIVPSVNGRGYAVQIWESGKKRRLGTFDTLAEAVNALNSHKCVLQSAS